MDKNWLLTSSPKKEGMQSILSCLGIIAGAGTLLLFSALFFTNISFTVQSTFSFTLTFLLLFISSYMMYLSLFETGKNQGEREITYQTLFRKREALFLKVRKEVEQEELSAFCKAFSERETRERKEALLRAHFLTAEEAACLLETETRSLSREKRVAKRALKRHKAIILSPRALLAEQPQRHTSAPLSHSPGQKLFFRTLSFLLPLLLFTTLSVSVACQVILNPGADTVVSYFLKLFTLLSSGLKGFRTGFHHITKDKYGYMLEQCTILEEFFKTQGASEE